MTPARSWNLSYTWSTVHEKWSEQAVRIDSHWTRYHGGTGCSRRGLLWCADSPRDREFPDQLAAYATGSYSGYGDDQPGCRYRQPFSCIVGQKARWSHQAGSDWSDRRQTGCRVSCRYFSDGIRDVNQYEHERGHLKSRHWTARWRAWQQAGASERPREPWPIEQRRDSDCYSYRRFRNDAAATATGVDSIA